MKLNMQHLLLTSVMMLTIGTVQCADADEALAQGQDRTVWRTNNIHGHPDTVLYQWGRGNPPFMIIETWIERWFGFSIQRKRIVYNSHDRLPPLFGFSGKNFFLGMLCGTVSTVTLGAAIAYVVAQQSQEGIATFAQDLPRLLQEAEQSLATQCIERVKAVVEPIESYTRHMVQGKGQSFVPKFEQVSVVPTIIVPAEGLTTIGGPIINTVCDEVKKSVVNTIDVAALKKALPQSAMLAGGSMATFGGLPQLFLGSKSFALGCIISSAATAFAMYVFASR